MKKRKITLETCKEIAKSRGGKCLSTEYINSQVPMLWECGCSPSHQWKTAYNNIYSKNSWCPALSGNMRKLINYYEEIAIKNGGKLLGDFKGRNVRIMWECKFSHQWLRAPRVADKINKANKEWCPVCLNSIKKNIEYCKEIAKSKGGKCLSIEYKNNKDILIWECGTENPHKWEASLNRVASHNSWCPYCNNGHSEPEIAWLNSLNVPKEFKNKTIKINNRTFKPDAIDEINKIIWEFYGHYYHGNSNKYEPNDINFFNKKTFEQLYKETIEREQFLKSAGYTLITIWESDFTEQLKLENKTIKDYLNESKTNE